MDTPITISSTLSSIEKSPNKFVVPHFGSSIARVPVSWDSPIKPCDRESNCTPDTLQKVNNWINSLSRPSRDYVESNNSSHRQSSDFSEYDMHENRLNMEDDLVTNMIVMSDYSKYKLKHQMMEDELDNYSRSSYESENAEGIQSTSKIPDEVIYSGTFKKHFSPKAIKRRKSFQIYNPVENDIDKSDNYDTDLPLSPESEKKKELCSYLQLMKPTDKKTVMILQNRRSMRVKNLSLLQEKRELEKKLREANVQGTNESGVSDNNTVTERNYPGLKPFEEMNIDLEKGKFKWLEYRNMKSPKELFFFPKPIDNLRETINDFDEVKVCWFEKRKEDAKMAHVSSPCNKEFKERIKDNKTMDNEIMSQDVNLKKKVEANKKHFNIIPDHIYLNKTNTELIKKEYATMHANVEVKRRVEVKKYTIADTNGLKTKMLEIHKKAKDNNRCKKKKEEPRKTERVDGNDIEKTRLLNLNSAIEPQFVIPKPSTHFVHDVDDFDVIFKQDLIKNNNLPSFPFKQANGNTEIQSEVLNDSGTLILPSSPIKLEEKNERTKLESKIFDPSKTKVHLVKKKTKAKKLNAKYKAQRSSFKIKLKPKRRSLGSQGKRDTKLTRSKSHLISDIMRSLRNRNIVNPPSKVNSIKKIITKKKQNFMNKKENMKQKVEKSDKRNIKPKHSEDNLELTLKTPLKDTNENPVKSTANSNITISPDEGINLKIMDGESKLTINENQSPKIKNLQNLMLDIDFSNLSTEHKTSLLVKNMNQGENTSLKPIIAIYHKNDNSNGLARNNFAKKKLVKTKEKGEFYSQILNIEKYPEEDSLVDVSKTNHCVEEVNKNKINVIQHYSFKSNEDQISILEKITENYSDLHSLTSVSKGCLTPISSREKSDRSSGKNLMTHSEATPFISFKKDIGVKSLHKCLNILTQKSVSANLEAENSPTSWPSESPSHKRKKSQHSINIFKEHGSVLKAFYLGYNLVLCQEFMVSFWTQTALGNVLGAQNMWIHKGSVQRLAMNNNCIFKESLEMVVSADDNVAYIELWTKEHQSDIREGPVADVFATIYFWKKGQNGLDKKVLQLENINGFADDVQYSVLKATPKIIVSWHLACSELESKKTYIHCYQLSADYQTVFNISEFEAVEHYVSSLHNIEGCDSLIMGCGENKITLWNIDYGYVVATIEMSEIKSPLCTLWVKCDRGFLFTLQQCVDRELRLIAVHGMNHSWKKLASYVPPDEYDRLKGVCVENGIVLAFYDKGILCWNAQTAEAIVEESHNDAEYISGKYVISVVNDQVNIRHAITHLLSAEDL